MSARRPPAEPGATARTPAPRTPAPRTVQEFRRFAAQHHPDRGGDPEVFAAGVAAWRARQAGPPVVFYRRTTRRARLLALLSGTGLLALPARLRGRAPDLGGPPGRRPSRPDTATRGRGRTDARSTPGSRTARRPGRRTE